MSELINNREYRQQELKEIIKDLHRGKSVDEVKERFQRLIKDIGPSEIALLEQRLIDEGLPEEITRLCDVHVSIFKDALDLQPEPEHIPGHPLHTFRAENEVIRKLSTEIRQLVQQLKDSERVTEEELDKWRQLHTQLLEIERHYSRKENILFPYLEKNGISGPPSVMWSIHDEIRGGLKEITRLLEAASPESAELQQGSRRLLLPCRPSMTWSIRKTVSCFPWPETLTEDSGRRSLIKAMRSAIPKSLPVKSGDEGRGRRLEPLRPGPSTLRAPWSFRREFSP